MNFLQRTPFFRLLLPLIAGIIFCEYYHISTTVFFVFLILAFFFIVIAFSFRKPKFQYTFRWLFGVSMFLFLFLLGNFKMHQAQNECRFEKLNIKGFFQVEITEAPVQKENSFLCRITTSQFIDSSFQIIPTDGRALIYIAKDSASAQLQSGDRLLIETTFSKPDGALNPQGFNYAGYLRRQGIGATAYIAADRWTKIETNTIFSIFRLAEKSQKNLLAVYNRFGINGDEFAVLAALTLGSKDALHPELRQHYTTSGGMHILAVSGLHVGIIYMVLGFLFKFLDRKPRLKLLKAMLIISLLWAYAFVTGLPPSVFRATMMFSLVAIGASMERKAQIYNTISFAAFIMLVFNPNFLFDVGFQLSFSAVVSIVYFQPKIAKWFTIRNKPMRWAWDLTAVSLAAQIGTAPLSVYYFHQFPNFFLLTNFIAIPFATLIIYTAVTLFALSPVPYISVAVAFLLQWLLKILNVSIEFIHDLPFSLSVFSINLGQVFFAFGTVILFSVFLNNKKFLPLAGSLVLVLAFLSVNILINYHTLNSSRFVVFADNKNTHISFIDRKNNYVFTTDSISVQRTAKNFWLSNKLNKPQKINCEQWFSSGFADFAGKRFLIMTNDCMKGKTAENLLNIDYLIIGNNLKPRIAEILECVHPKKIIVDLSVSEWYTQSIKKACNEKNISFYSVAEHGAYMLNLTENFSD
ncbi:MAG: ComEC/Rec2 family competence protein [Paludibacter sp.]|nr:ComEC/Rec2 family competence protein [Paludibacter sp.]